jgi:hypothetical protein
LCVCVFVGVTTGTQECNNNGKTCRLQGTLLISSAIACTLVRLTPIRLTPIRLTFPRCTQQQRDPTGTVLRFDGTACTHRNSQLRMPACTHNATIRATPLVSMHGLKRITTTRHQLKGSSNENRVVHKTHITGRKRKPAARTPPTRIALLTPRVHHKRKTDCPDYNLAGHHQLTLPSSHVCTTAPSRTRSLQTSHILGSTDDVVTGDTP